MESTRWMNRWQYSLIAWRWLAFCLFVYQPDAIRAQTETPDLPRKLVVATKQVPPFAMQDDDGRWIGVSIDLLRGVIADLRSQADHEVLLEFREYGLRDMLDAVAAGEVHLAAAALTVNYDREKLVDFTHPFYSSGLGIAVAARPERGWRRVLAAVASWTFFQMLVALFLVLLASGILLYFFERKANPEHFGGGPVKGVASGLWWAAVTVTTVGYGDKVPKTLVGRTIGFIWMFLGLFIIAGFTAAVTSKLTVTQLRTAINGPEDLSRVRVGTVVDSTSAKYLQAQHIVSLKYGNVADALAALKESEIDAVVYDAPVMRFERHQHPGGDIHILPVTFERQDYAFALPPQSPLRERINLILLRKTGSPEWKDVLANYLGVDSE